MKLAVGVMVIGLLGMPSTGWAQAPAWQLVGRGLNAARISAVAVDPQNARLLYAGSGGTVYASADGGMTWRACFRAPGQTTVAWLAVDPFDSRRILAATDRGLYGSFDGARHWQRLFRGAGAGEAACSVVLFHPAHRRELFVGTGGGLFRSDDGGRSWRAVGSRLSDRSVFNLAVDPSDPQRLYALTDQGVFMSAGTLEEWTRIFEVSRADEPSEEAESAEELPEELERSHQPTALAIDPQDPQRLYLATLGGAFFSQDRGATWQRLTQVGLGTSQIRHLILHAHSPVVAYAATPLGVARYRPQEERWEVLYAGLPTQAARFLAATDTKVYAATDQGLYMLDLTKEHLAEGNWPSAREILGNFVYEPTIAQVRETAVRYAEVEPEKIQRWRHEARLKALFPTLSMGYDHDQDTYIASSVTSTNSRAITLADPSKSLKFSVNWDLGDLIWSTDQTSIDTRSRLMVQLRDDILDEITRNYFERRRLQIELLTEPPSDPKVQLEKELRLQELTAVIDGLTGGWFSQQLEFAGGSR